MVIVGSGAGGSVLAARLTAAGLRVVMLEAGPWVTKEQLTLREEDAFQGMYQDRGTRFTGRRQHRYSARARRRRRHDGQLDHVLPHPRSSARALGEGAWGDRGFLRRCSSRTLTQ